MSVKRKIIIFEDSSKVQLGAGQRITLATIETLLDAGFEVVVYDYSKSKIFTKKCRDLGACAKYYKSGHSTRSVVLNESSSET